MLSRNRGSSSGASSGVELLSTRLKVLDVVTIGLLVGMSKKLYEVMRSRC